MTWSLSMKFVTSRNTKVLHKITKCLVKVYNDGPLFDKLFCTMMN